jgi:hypothetical protein
MLAAKERVMNTEEFVVAVEDIEESNEESAEGAVEVSAFDIATPCDE